jgi:hypothetical protein
MLKRSAVLTLTAGFFIKLFKIKQVNLFLGCWSRTPAQNISTGTDAVVKVVVGGGFFPPGMKRLC